MSSVTDTQLDTWLQNEARAEAMVPMVGSLYRDRDVVVSIYGRNLVLSLIHI